MTWYRYIDSKVLDSIPNGSGIPHALFCFSASILLSNLYQLNNIYRHKETNCQHLVNTDSEP